MNLKPTPPKDRQHLIKGSKWIDCSYGEQQRLGYGKNMLRQMMLAKVASNVHPDCHGCKLAEFHEYADPSTMKRQYGASCTQTTCKLAQWSIKTGPIIKKHEPPTEEEINWAIMEAIMDEEFEDPGELCEPPPTKTDVPNIEGAGAW